MNLYVTLEEGSVRETHFPATVMNRLATLGDVKYNNTADPLSEAQLAACLPWADICLTHWRSPCFTPQVLEQADRLKLIVHCAGSVADVCTAAVYERGILVASANDIMAAYVAEGVLAYILAALREVPRADFLMKNGDRWPKPLLRAESLFGKTVSLIGLGATGRELIRLLEPFGVRILIYDPYLFQDSIAALTNASLCTLDEALSQGDIVSVHASLTKETIGMLGERELSLLRDGALLVNTARGAIISEAPLIRELSAGRIRAVLDVYEPEPPLPDHPLRSIGNAVLVPHMAGSAARENMTYAMLHEIERFCRGEPLKHLIPRERFEKMTSHSLVGTV
jgi:phosphoglycerate dehydrogenase-like enzyme